MENITPLILLPCAKERDGNVYLLMKWKILQSEYIFKDLWFTVRADTCERGDGKIVTPYYVYEFPTWVCALAITEDGMVIMEKQYRHALDVVAFEVPGGCVDETDKSLKMPLPGSLWKKRAMSLPNTNTSARPAPILLLIITGCICSWLPAESG